MATGVQTAGFNQQEAAALLRKNQQAARKYQPSLIGKMAERATRNVRAAFFASDLLSGANSLDNTEWSAPTFGDENRIEYRADADDVPENVGQAEAALAQEEQYAAQMRRNFIKRATNQSALRLPAASDLSLDSAEYDQTYDAYEEEAEQLRADSYNRDVSQLGPIRGQLNQLAGEGMKQGEDAIKKELEKQASRVVAQFGGDALNAIDTPGEDGWITWFLTLIYTYIRVATSIFVQDPSDMRIQSASDAGGFMSKKVVLLIFPKYKLIGGSATDIADFAYLIWILILTGIIMAVLTAVVMLLFIVGYAYYYGFDLGFILGF